MRDFIVTHCGIGPMDCWCERVRVTDSEGVARVALSNTMQARSLFHARQATDPRCTVTEAVQAERVAA